MAERIGANGLPMNKKIVTWEELQAKNSETETLQEMPLAQFGGRFGKDETGEDINDDGISHKVEGGLSIEIEHTASGGTHFLKTRIV